MPTIPLCHRLTLATAALLAGQVQALAAAPLEAAPAAQDARKESRGALKAKPVAKTKAGAPEASLPLVDVAPLQRVEIKGAAASYDPRRDDTASKIIVGSEEIQRYGDTAISDVLKRLPGITVTGAGGRGGGEVRMRGLGSGYTQILLNGEAAPAGFSLDSLSPDVIERIEILRAASAEFSTQSIAGTINIVLKKAIKMAQREFKLSYGRGSDYSSPNASMQLSDKDGGFSYSLGANVYRYRFERDYLRKDRITSSAGELTQELDSVIHDKGESNGFNISPRLNWTLGENDTLTSQSFFNLNRYVGAGALRVSPVSGQVQPVYLGDDSSSDTHNAYGRSDLNWVHKIEGGARLDTKIGVSGSRNNNLFMLTGFDAGRHDILGRIVRGRTREQGISSTGKYSTPLIPEHALSMGWDGAVNRRDEQRMQRETTLPANTSVPTDDSYLSTVRRMALFAQDEWNITPRWSMYLGMRWEGLETRSEGNHYSAIRSRSSVFSPLMQTLYKLPDSKDQMRLALTRTYRAPGLGSLIPRRYLSTNNSPTDPDGSGNPQLKPELALGLDGAYEHYFAETGLVSASAYVRRIDQFIRPGILYEDGRYIATSVNDGRALSRGIELEAKFPLDALMAQAPALDLRASVSRHWSRVQAVPGPDNRLDQQNPLSANLGLDYKTPGGKLATGASFAFRNGGPVRVSEAQRHYQSVRRDLDLYALWKFDPQYQLRLALSNVLHRDFLSQTSYTDANGVSQRRNATYPGTTQIRLTLEVKR
ncbi:TonB-dependent receptor [Oxalobacteraceae bacterium]|nr:TonB-dependent receptor [Oxalobacteraceae bacterium]